jgi:hypothetical protein
VIFDIIATENGEILILATDGRIQIGIRDEHSQNGNPLISFNFEFGSNVTMESDATLKTLPVENVKRRRNTNRFQF